MRMGTLWMDGGVKVRHEWRANERELRWTDTRIDEQQRGISIKMTPMTLVMEASSGKSRLFTMLDCPGHVNFNDEVTAAMRLADGVMLVVDAVEGVMVVTERAIKQAVQENLPICLMISKVSHPVTTTTKALCTLCNLLACDGVTLTCAGLGCA
jgi:U5 small nuclear ribonucleoprotein component